MYFIRSVTCVEGGDTLKGVGEKAEEQGDSEKKNISESGEMTQHKEEWGEDEEGNPEIINEGGGGW